MINQKVEQGMRNSVNSKFRSKRKRFLLRFEKDNKNYPYAVVDSKFNNYVGRNFKTEEEAISWRDFQNKTPTFGHFEIPKCIRIYNT